MQSHVPSTQPLKVIVAGAGLGGLAAGIALRDAGHEVDVGDLSGAADVRLTKSLDL